MNNSRYIGYIEHAWESRQKQVEGQGTRLYRLYDRDDPQFTKAVIDVFRDWVVIRLYEDMSSEAMDDLVHAIAAVLLPKGIYLNDRRKDVDPTQLNFFLWGEKHPDVFIVEENQHKFLIDMETRLDNGLFLDLRLLRKWVEHNSENKRVLNLFSYTGSFSIYAARGGAHSSASADMSKTYNAWAQSNYELNLIDSEKHKLYTMEVMDFLGYAQKQGMQFDLIIADPPTFSRSKQQIFDLTTDYPELITACHELLADRGTIVFSHHQRDLKLNTQSVAGLYVKDVSNKFLPFDFRDIQAHQCYFLST